MDLVTGGSGYFGNVLVKNLLSKGRECSILDILPSSDHSVPFIQADIRHFNAVLKACQGIETVFHMAAQVPLEKNAKVFQSVNTVGTENLFKAALKAGVKKVVYLSSSAVFGVPKVLPITPDTATSPSESYGRSKVEAEHLCQKYVDLGLDITIIRPRTILGDGRLGIFQILFEWVYKGFNIPVLGGGEKKYQFIQADDLAEACYLASRRSGPSTYNCGASRYGSMKKMLEVLCKHAGTGSKVKSLPLTPIVWGMKLTSKLGLSPLGDYHWMMYGRPCYFDIQKVEADLGWTPNHSNEEMIIESYDWYVKNRDAVLKYEKASHQRSAVKQGILSIVKRCI